MLLIASMHYGYISLCLYLLCLPYTSTIELSLQGSQGFLTAHVDGKTHDVIFSTRDDVWRKRRRILSPAFSAHKMKLVSVGICKL